MFCRARSGAAIWRDRAQAYEDGNSPAHRLADANKKADQGVEDPDQPGETVAASPVVTLVPTATAGTELNMTSKSSNDRENAAK
ncbi:hypothetical protein GCM10010862_06340 [Devosia nitrariae]|uniref:Uncharacterized protein n=1 Tax=Devosia nitrariae TaxID=2071872 RepID=A0ABQ5W0E6_9HYPH|nr:hypothetical protein GCM10010862_06340 [Devosia nitrariae]